MRYPIIIDFETKKSFKETTKHQELGISVAGAYDYKQNKYHVFEENELARLFKLLEQASIVIGFNIIGFDLPVLQKYYPGNISQFATFDILLDIKKELGRRIPLDNLAQATLGRGKTGHGLKAIALYREGKIEELKRYCRDDVEITKELLEYGAKNHRIFFNDIMDKKEIRVQWNKYVAFTDNSKSLSLTLPF